VSFSSPPKTFGHSENHEVRRDEHAAVLVALGDGVGQQLAAGAVEWHEADFVEDEQVNAVESALRSSEFACIARFNEDAHEVRCTREGDTPLLPYGLDAERDREVSLARADRPGEDHVLGALEPAAARELGDLSSIDALGGGEVELVERLSLRESCIAQTLTDGRLSTR
jgi:hypothetical protein